MNKMLLAAVVLAYGVTGCGASNGASSPNPPNVANVKANVLQFAVGTANLYGVANAGLNVVATYRQPSGATLPGGSGTLANSITLTVPAGVTLPGPGAGSGMDCLSTVLTDAAPGELGGSAMTSTPQTAQASGAAPTTFGQSGGVFGLGIEPFNYEGSANNAACSGSSNPGEPYSYVPYPVPLYQGTTAAANSVIYAFTPWGGVPAFDVAGNGQSIVNSVGYQSGVSGTELGIDVFNGVTPAAGSYSLGLTVTTTTAGAPATSQTYALNTPTGLGTATAPAFVADGTGGGTFPTFTMPAGATEALIEVTDYGPSVQSPAGLKCATANANGAGGTLTGAPGAQGTKSTGNPLYYTIEATASGSQTLPDTAGPSGSYSVCPGDIVTVAVIGADYPLAEMAYTNATSAKNPAPTFEGANGSAGAGDNITVSVPICGQAPAAAGATTVCPATDTFGTLTMKRVMRPIAAKTIHRIR